jgi:hypothetical protein
MNIAMRIDFARAYGSGTDARMLALALASGVAGLSITYPTITVDKGGPDSWSGRSEMKTPRLTMSDTVPETSVSTRFQDSALAAADAVVATTAGISSALSPILQPITEAVAADLTRYKPVDASAAPAVASMPDDPGLMPSSASPSRIDTLTPGTRIRLPEPAFATIVRTPAVPAEPVEPLDPVHIALPRVSAEMSTVGAVTLDPSPKPAAAPQQPAALPPQTVSEQAPAFAANPRPEALANAEAGPLSSAQPLGFMAASKEVRDFDLAKLAKPKPTGLSALRSAINAQQTSGSTRMPSATQELPKSAKVPDKVVGDYIMHEAGLSLEGMPSGKLTVRIGMGGDISVKLADLLTPIRDQMSPDTFERLANSAAATQFVSFSDLRATGFDIRYDAGNDRLMVSAQP